MFNALGKWIAGTALLWVLALADSFADGVSVLRVRTDPARGREWILSRDGVQVLDQKSKKNPALVRLPEWTWAEQAYACSPDLALGPAGEALVSSNVVPILWRVDAETLRVTVHAPVLDADADKDVGFTGIVYSKELGAYFAVSEIGSVWRIDPRLKRAQKIPLSAPLPGGCAIAALPRAGNRKPSRFFSFCVRGSAAAWRVNLAPDQRSAHVLAEPC